MSNSYTEQEIAFIISTKDNKDLSWNDIADRYNKKFKKEKTPETIRECYKRYIHLFSDDQFVVKKLIIRKQMDVSFVALTNSFW